ncbi:MAG: spore coat protein CotJB [Thermoflexaceae bacterium]|nr:spore coat protein CotJB [Thermoflexaceae bacterium]
MNQGNGNLTRQQIPDRCDLMKSIYEIGFSLDDMILYLDTHPKDREALDYYHKLHKQYHELVRLYSRNYGPLFAKDVHNENYFSWVNRPMPWEGDV